MTLRTLGALAVSVLTWSTALTLDAGSSRSEPGCPGHWSPDCLRSWLQDPDGDGTHTFTTDAIPAGDHEVKAALGLSWAVSYGADAVPDGGDIGFSVPADGDAVTFSYVAATNVLNASPDVTHQTVPGAAEQGWTLVPSRRWGSDATVRRARYDAEAGAFSVPGRTVAIFERR